MKNLLKNKFHKVSLGSIFFGYFIFLVCIFTYVVNKHTSSLVIMIISELLFVIGTVVGSSLTTALFISSKSNDEIINDVFNNGLLQSQNALNDMSSEWKRNCIYSLMNNEYYKGSTLKKEMHQEILEKVYHDFKLCYLKYDVDVVCKIHEGKIIKKVTKNMHICSSGESFSDDDFKILGKFCCSKFNSKTVIKEVLVNGKVAKTFERKKIDTDGLEVKNENDLQVEYVLKDKIDIPQYSSVSSGTHISVVYETTTSILDNSHIFRLTYPCKDFSIKYKLLEDNGKDEYKLSAEAFGFNSKGEDGGSESKGICRYFKDWIFKFDGVAVYIEKKGESL